MQKICVAVVDDSVEYADFLSQIVRDYIRHRTKAAEITSFQSGEEILLRLEEGATFDIYLLDVELSWMASDARMNGMDVAGYIRKRDQEAYIVFISSHEKYAIQAFQYKALYYIQKDRCLEVLPTVLEEIFQHMERRESGYYLISNEKRWKKINLNDVTYIDRQHKNVQFHCKDGAIYQERKSLQDVYRELPEDCFIFISRGQLVNLWYVKETEYNRDPLADGAGKRSPSVEAASDPGNDPGR